MLADRSGPRALRRRAGGGGRRRPTAISPKTRSELIEVDYAPLPAIVDPLAALRSEAAAVARGSWRQYRERPLVPLWRSRTRVRRGRAESLGFHPLPA